jgi:hypothetical protein
VIACNPDASPLGRDKQHLELDLFGASESPIGSELRWPLRLLLLLPFRRKRGNMDTDFVRRPPLLRELLHGEPPEAESSVLSGSSFPELSPACCESRSGCLRTIASFLRRRRLSDRLVQSYP